MKENRFAHDSRPLVLIGGLSRTVPGAVATVNEAFMEGLQESFRFIPHFGDRKHGLLSRGTISLLNLAYLLSHGAQWVWKLFRNRPAIAHYPVTSQRNLEKSLLFLSAARWTGAATVGHLHGGAFDTFWKSLPARRKRRAQRTLFRLGALVVLSDGWKRWVVEHIGLPEEQVHVVNNPIERTFERAALEWNEPPGGDVFFVGALGERKGVYDILEAAPSLAQAAPGTRIVLVGPGDREGDLEGIGAKIDSARLRNVEIRGPLYGEEKKELFRTHGIFLFPSHSENFPLVILEAAAAGRAIITTRVGAVPEFFEHDRSVLFVMQKDIAGITGAVVRLVSDRALRADLGREARKVFLARLSRASVMEAMGRTYRAVLASPTGSRGIGRPVRPAGGAENDSPRVYSGGRAGA